MISLLKVHKKPARILQMAIEKVNTIISDLLKRAKKIETEDSKSFMELDELRQWAAALQEANDEGPNVIDGGTY